MNPPFVNGRYIDQWETPINEWLVLAYGRDQFPTPQALPNGYIISSDIEANKYLFFKPPYYDPAILTLVDKTKRPVTEGEGAVDPCVSVNDEQFRWTCYGHLWRSVEVTSVSTFQY
jgi:hypothetical protein